MKYRGTWLRKSGQSLEGESTEFIKKLNVT